jgi:hypothetical protein
MLICKTTDTDNEASNKKTGSLFTGIFPKTSTYIHCLVNFSSEHQFSKPILTFLCAKQSGILVLYSLLFEWLLLLVNYINIPKLSTHAFLYSGTKRRLSWNGTKMWL